MQVKLCIEKKEDEIEQLRKKIKDEKVVTEDDITLVEAEIVSIESNANEVPIEELKDIEKVIEKSVIGNKEDFYEHLSSIIDKDFTLTNSEISPNETPVDYFEEETKDFKLVAGKSPKRELMKHKEDLNSLIERVDTTLKVKNNKLFDRIRTELYSDYGQYLNSIEFDTCCIDCEEAIKIGQLLAEKETFNLSFVDTKGSIQILLSSMGSKTIINELGVANSGLQEIVNYFNQKQKVNKVIVENMDAVEGMALGKLIELIGKNTEGRSMVFKGMDFHQIPIVLFKHTASLKELHLVKCQLANFEGLIEILMDSKEINTSKSHLSQLHS